MLGVGVVKQRIVTGFYADPWKNIAQGWVERKEASSSAQRLSLARQANRIAIAALVYCRDFDGYRGVLAGRKRRVQIASHDPPQARAQIHFEFPRTQNVSWKNYCVLENPRA